MSTAPNVSILASNQPSAGGFTALVEPATTTTGLVSCNYIIYPGNNITGSISNVPNNLYNRTVNVGSDNCSNLGSNDYSLFIDTSVCLPNHDYYVSVSTLYTDGTQSPFSSAVLLPLAASKITLNSVSVTLTRSPDTYVSQALIKVFFTQPAAPPSGNLSYTLGIQYIDGNGSNKFSLVPGLSYNTDSVQTTLIDANGIDEAYVAIQSVRNVSVSPSSGSSPISVSATSELSNTVMAIDTDVPDPPRNLVINYEYYNNQQVTLNWNAPFSALLTDVAGFKVYRRVASGSFQLIGSVVFTTIGATYSFINNVSSIALNTTVSYYVTSFRNNPSAESVPSQIVSIVTVLPSSAPQNASATGLQVTFSGPYLQDVTTAFGNPSSINGLTSFGYSGVAQFTVQIIDVNDPLTPSVIATNTVPYVASSTGYGLNFNNIPFSTNGTLNSSPGLYQAKIWLNTFDGSGDTIIGQASTVNFESGPRPIISSVNGLANQWTIIDALTSFTVTTSSLAPLVDLFIVYRKKIDNTIEINRPAITTPVIDSLENYIYSFNSGFLPSSSHLALNISAANAFGNGISTITGQIL